MVPGPFMSCIAYAGYMIYGPLENAKKMTKGVKRTICISLGNIWLFSGIIILPIMSLIGLLGELAWKINK